MAVTTLTPSLLSGIGVPYALEADRDASTLGEYGPRAGYPEPQEDASGRRPAMALSATGEQTSTTMLTVATQRAGNVGDGTVVFKRTVSGVADTDWHGADQMNVLVGAAFPGWSAVANQREPHAVTLDDDSIVTVYRQTNGVTYDVRCIVWNPLTDTHGTAVTVVSGLDVSHVVSPALLVLPDPAGSVNPFLLCAYWVANDSTNEAQIDVKVSRDGGATWAYWSRGVLPAAIDINSGSPYYTLGRIRWAMVGSQVALYAHLTSSASVSSEKEHVNFYASANYGVSFTLIKEKHGYGWPDVATVGSIAYLYLVTATASPSIEVYPVRSAFVDPSSATPGDPLGVADMGVTSGTPAVFSFCAFAVTARRDGRILLVGIRVVGSAYVGYAALWDPATSSARKLSIYGFPTIATWWYDALSPSTEYPQDLAAVVYRGQGRVYCTLKSSVGTYDDRLTRLDLGGVSTVTMPDAQWTAVRNAAWRRTTLPNALSTVYGWTFTGAGTRSISTNAGWETLTTVANTAYNTITRTSGATEQMWQLWRVKVDSGGGVTSRVVACGLRAAGVGYGYEVEARFSTTQIRLRDVGGAADLTTITIDTSTTGVDILMALSGSGLVSCWARVIGTDERRTWTPIEEGYQLTDDTGAGGTTPTAMFGNRASGTATSRWIALGNNEGGNLQSADLASGPTNPDDLTGIEIRQRGVYLAAGVSIGAKGGPALPGETWVIRPDADHPVRYALPVGDETSARNVVGGQRTTSREPASAWWSTATTGYLSARFPDAANRAHPALLALHVEGLNAPNPTVYGYDYDAASRTSLGVMENTAPGLRFLRPSASSATVRLDASGSSTSTPYIRAGSLRGSYFRFSVGGKVRPILDNTEGKWGNGGTGAYPVLTLGGIDGTEPTSGSAGAIIYSRATFIVAMTAAAEYGRFELGWGSAPDIYEAQIRCSIFAVCPVEPLLYARDWGTAYKVEDPAELIEARSGIRRGRKVKLEPRRSLSLPLTMLWDQRPLLDPTGQTPAVYKAYNNASYPLAGVFGDEFGKLLGAWRRAGGSESPVLWLPRISTAATTQTLVGDAAGFYCRVTSPPQFTADYGEDAGGAQADVIRGDTWTLEEEI